MRKNFFNSRPKKKNNALEQLFNLKKEVFTNQNKIDEFLINSTVDNYSAVLLLCLKDKFSFTTEELTKVTCYINDTFDSIDQGYISLNDIIETLKLENDLDVRFLREATNE